MYSITETAEMLDISPNLCRGLVKAGTLKSVIVGKRHKITDDFLDDFLKNSIYAPERVFKERKRGKEVCRISKK